MSWELINPNSLSYCLSLATRLIKVVWELKRGKTLTVRHGKKVDQDVPMVVDYSFSHFI